MKRAGCALIRIGVFMSMLCFSLPAFTAVGAGDDRVGISNGLVGVEMVRVGETHRLSRAYGIKERCEYLPADFATDEVNLWQIMLKTNKGRSDESLIVSIADAQASSAKITRQKNETVLLMRWTGIGLPGNEEAIEVAVTVSMSTGDPLSRWRIDVRNRSDEWGIWQVRFPMLKLTPIGDDRSDNVLLIPKDRGRLVEDCFNAPSGFGHGFDADEPPPIGFGQSMPGSLSMQFQALYNRRSGKGLFLSTRDSNMYSKHLQLVGSRNCIGYGIGHDPANMGYPEQDYGMPYDFAIGPFNGDWWDAAQIYRKWALKQPWCAKGSVKTRADIPKWLKESSIFLTTHTFGTDSLVQANMNVWMEYLRLAGSPVGGTWYGWKRYDTELTSYDLPHSEWRVPEKRSTPVSNVHDGNYPKLPALKSFSEACRAIGQAGGYPAPYVCLQIYDQGGTKQAPYYEDAYPHVSRDLDGSIKYFPWEPSWLMCVSTDWWRNRLAETCRELLMSENVSGIYLDTLQGGAQPCFETSHGHSYGGGNYRTRDMHELARICRQAVKSANPTAFTDGENPTEEMIDVVDGILYQRTMHPQISAPVFAAVYGDYIPRWGIRCDLTDSEEFLITASSLFLEGAKIGRIHTYANTEPVTPSDPRFVEQVSFLEQMISYYRDSTAREFLCYGRVMRPLGGLTSQYIECKNSEFSGYQGGISRVPVLQSGVFRASNGDIGIFVVNIGRDKLKFSTRVDMISYGMDVRRKHKVVSITPDGNRRTVRTGRRSCQQVCKCDSQAAVLSWFLA